MSSSIVTTQAAPHSCRVARARAEMRALGLDALLVSHAPNIRYLTGFAGSAGLLVLTEQRCTLVVDFRYASAARALAAAGHNSLFDVVVSPRAGEEAVVGLLERAGARRTGIEATWMSVERFNSLADAILAAAGPVPTDTGGPVLVPTARLIERARMVKDAREIATMREAGRRIAALAPAAIGRVQAGRSERDVAAEVDGLLRRSGFERPAFETIVASGPNSALPHARPAARVLQPGDAVVLDFGGVYDGYCVDLTRTVQLGEPAPTLRRLFEAVSAAQAAAIAAAGPGVKASDVDRAARGVLEAQELGGAFGHATGHGLGLEVHEDPRIGPETDGQPDPILAAGMVFTIEPGAYLEGIGGVRIEDDVLITEGGCEVLTRPA